MDQSRGIGILSAAILLLITGLVCGEEPKLVSLNDIPAMSIRFLLGPWTNENQIQPDRQSGYDLIRIEIAESGELAMHLPN
ncbi:MAG: hypothetical protein H6Q04_1088 [Acidobacteria bacterium]|jgi:hypothetical protein|nr:hypothetical protein [Acidobacteriota bacterium]